MNTTKILITFFILNVTLIGVQLGVTFYRSTDGIALHNVQIQIQNSKQESQHLKDQIYLQSALGHIQISSKDQSLRTGVVRFVNGQPAMAKLP